MQAIMQEQLNALSQVGAWGSVEKSHQDMVFLLPVLSIAMRCERVFGLTMVWAHLCQAHIHTLDDVTHKLVLLADESVDWPYAFIWLNDVISHLPLSSDGHISTMMDGTPSTDAWGWFHQLQMCKLLQHKDTVVLPEGLNGELEALQCTFQELPLWNTAAPSKPAHEPQLIEVDLSSMQAESMATGIQLPLTALVQPHFLADTMEPPHDITTVINLLLQGALEQLLQAYPSASTPVSQHSMLRIEQPLVALGTLLSTKEAEDSPRPGGTDPVIPNLTATPHKCPHRHPHQMAPWLHSHHSPTAPADCTKDTEGGKHLLYLTA